MKKRETPLNEIQTGRPAGSTIYDRKEFIKKAKAAYARALKRGKPPSREVIARKLGISRATLYRYLQKYVSWSEIREDER
jgi:DNA invertase Pin-like site-specific DNA recombinase